MPTPVSSARQYLTEEAARALDDAVAVARRRNHAQTTSLHIVSALLTLPSSTLRDACRRARSCSYSPRLQFQALELSVGVSLDRLPTSKNIEEEPPVSNSLMAAIKRSQANQRRHPESFHLLQMYNQQQQTTSFLKVELKQFILSILDDPIVSRVFGEAGFRSCDIKIALLQPPMPQASQFSRSRYTPIFLPNLTGSEMGRPGFNFPFMGNPGIEDGDENCRRIGEVLSRKTNRNPLLMGVSAKGALRSFIESVQKGRGGVFPAELTGLNIICIDKEISEFLVECGSEEKMGLKFKDLNLMAEQCPGPGIAVNYGELEAFIGDAVSTAAVRFVVSQLTSLLQIHGGKLWLVGVAGTSDTYSKFLDLFPKVEKDWDLYILPMTSVTYSTQGLYSKSSLMGSFVPFGGFFSTPPEFENPVSSTNQSFTCCHVCKEKYEKEVADVGKIGPTASPSDCSKSLPWLQKKKVNVDVDEGLDVAKTSEDKTLNAKVLGLQKKWSDICRSDHHTQSLSEADISQTRFPSTMGLIFGSGFKESSSKDPPSQSSQSIFPSKQILPVPVLTSTVDANTGSDQVAKVSKSQQTDMQSPRIASPSTVDCRSSSCLNCVTTDLGLGTLYTSPAREPNTTLLNCKSPSSLTSVTTDLGLGTIYRSAAQEPNTPRLRDHKEHHHHLSNSPSTDLDATNESSSQPKAQSLCSGPNLEGKFDSLDFKSLNLRLTEKVCWQDEAIYAIGRTLSLYRSGIGKHRGSHVRGDIWLALRGPDSVGKKKIASALAEVISGNTESLISVDLGSQDRVHPSNSIFECQKSYCFDVLTRKTVVDYIAGELSKKPQSVVFLENVEKADILLQTSLFQAIRLGKFPDSHGREISINNTIFLVTSTAYKGNSTSLSEEHAMFSEETILEAKRCPVKLLLGHTSEDVKRSGGTNVKIAPKRTLNPTSSNKRNLPQGCDSSEQTTASKMPRRDPETSRSNLDLNMPLEEVEEEIHHNACKSESSVKNSEAWLKDFFSQIEEVAFKPFNFDALAENFLKSISMQFQRRFRSEVLLEIEYEVMVQILAAAWLSDKKYAVEDWVEHVLGRCFNEAQHKHHPGAQCVMKLVTCEGTFVEEQVAGICLPATINLN
ncbi:hypothetical protein L6164_025990 [Bauhinia variegata]|uniref:Uncharacterized protein n=1 Tax=Bauhinia variegata TaxID=167791 RepID=A0ACB9M296_BAUVA|nr:hypothetical protein L6164_025990 [Bauhinia variegata]